MENIKDYPVTYGERSIATLSIPGFREKPIQEGSLHKLPDPKSGFLPKTRTRGTDELQAAYGGGLGGLSLGGQYRTKTGNYLTVYRPNAVKPSELDLPAFDEYPVGGHLAGLDMDLWGTISNLLPTVVSAGGSALTASYAVKQAHAEADRIRAEAASTSALAQIQAAASSSKTLLIVAAVAGAGLLGYFFLKGKN